MLAFSAARPAVAPLLLSAGRAAIDRFLLAAGPAQSSKHTTHSCSG